MPRKSRIDAPGALHHIIARGIDRGLIFRDEEDRHRWIDRFGGLLAETGTACYAWALLPNHFHLLLRTGGVPVAGLMRRLLTGYAIGFNHRHLEKTVEARSLLCYWSVRHLGLSMSSLARRLGISPTSVSQSVVRGEGLAKKGRYQLPA